MLGFDIYQALMNKREAVTVVWNGEFNDPSFLWELTSVFGGNGLCRIRNGHLNGGQIIQGASRDRVL